MQKAKNRQSKQVGNEGRMSRNVGTVPEMIGSNENPNMITKRLVKYSIFYLILLGSLSILRYFVARSGHYNDRVIDPVEIAL